MLRSEVTQPTMTDETDDVELTDYTVTQKRTGDEVKVPKHIMDRTENLLGSHPMTNQNIILDTIEWWFDNCGNCPIYKWCINRLDALENSDVRMNIGVFRSAYEQGKDIFGEDFVEEEVTQ